ncbi:chorismate--pyruvate lyase family protein [Rhodoferax antarcticus]|uniref:Probable chorismate pyruvate-lyase n=2 Tax=Rhodoferax antarcticus TaxID=81479 RepID=A0A1Q8YDV9_9BURK|nr:chorismate lyase [Rhodoferax antarcticus]OLP06193.1 chorismate lyase family protein [Rhodoferax antarcticus ANT.BR]
MMRWTPYNFAQGGMGRWLQATGSLSARLAATGKVFSVQVLRQGRMPLTEDEAQALGVAGPRLGYVREVLLKVDGVSVVFARSVTAHAHSLGAWRSVRGLGTRPLANVLFTRSGITRQAMQYRQFGPHSALLRQVQQLCAGVPRGLSARRSVFMRQCAPLLVMEVFIAPQAAWRWPAAVWQITD